MVNVQISPSLIFPVSSSMQSTFQRYTPSLVPLIKTTLSGLPFALSFSIFVGVRGRAPLAAETYTSFVLHLLNISSIFKTLICLYSIKFLIIYFALSMTLNNLPKPRTKHHCISSFNNSPVTWYRIACNVKLLTRNVILGRSCIIF